jgi:hypothetical protein
MAKVVNSVFGTELERVVVNCKKIQIFISNQDKFQITT